MYEQLKSLLYLAEPEWAHEHTLLLAQGLSHTKTGPWLADFLWGYEDDRLSVEIGGLVFPNPVGLAAGFDKDGVAIGLLEAVGFGAIEVGTLTPKPQLGNPQPRLFRLVEDKALINRMGFNNGGIDRFVNRVSGQTRKRPLGVNLGKNKDTPNEQAGADYCYGLEKTYDLGDYFTINISSPNTVGLRALQEEKSLLPLLQEITAKRDHLARFSGKRKPLWLKVAPDLSAKEMEVICQIALSLKIDALVVSNTTLERPALADLNRSQTGGLSGAPLTAKADQALDWAFGYTHGQIPLVGVGGIMNAAQALRKFELGASFVQVYSGLIFSGPGLVKQIKEGLIASLNRERLPRLPKRVV
ncbi:MAG: dihydroorotate dehydrogenase (quinone) [Candidatus Lambdaproteobacteria bacterium RIFOXYD2_FULL_50_16]|uniref:Dihydroorotate dehydrogenase (quinone) n=1 Tax=Candidatus Lambdaproteobacteria bacterium RIFOXYD2_FULL_50_16 TaxID=1817772 RepID=A0A1F6GGC1_9PROT|nr:MAG: dihydroorotate dehydrogenase (quinone) [Candidatus Lambdaproteobacteria bacterium RIFOXYD2_FULL_50_16]